MFNLEEALKNPAGHFESPDAVCDAPGLTQEDKVHILRRWEYDARELEVAEEENMAGGPPDVLAHILQALHRLGASSEASQSSTTKQGGE